MADNVYPKTYADGAALTEAKLDTSFKGVAPDIAQTAQLSTGSSDGQVLTSTGSGLAAAWEAIPDPKGPFAIRNYGLAASVSSGTLTIALKGNDGNDPSASNVVDIAFSSNGAASAVVNNFQQTAAKSLTITASATLGVLTATTANLYVYAVRASSSTLNLAVSTKGNWDDGTAQTTVAMSSASDVENQLYSNVAAGTYPVRLLGWVRASHTNGSWNTIYKVNVSNTPPTSRAFKKAANQIAFTSTSNTFVQITNASVTLICSGMRPVLIMLTQDIDSSSATISYVAANKETALSGDAVRISIQCRRDGTVIGAQDLAMDLEEVGNGEIEIRVPPSSFIFHDIPTAGSHGYTLHAKIDDATTYETTSIDINNCAMLAYEI